MSEIIAALLIIAPGMVVANYTIPRNGSLAAFLCESIVWSLLLDSATSWVPGGDRVPLWLWTASLIVIGLAGLVAGVIRFLNRSSRLKSAGSLWLLLPAVTTFAVYAVIVIVRPNIDWDALTYYLPVSVQYVASGHTTSTLYPFVSTVPGTPNTQPPILPQLYASAIMLAEWLHSTADQSIRLISMVFVVGIYLSTVRLARRYLSENLARFAGLVAILLPTITAAVVAYPLYLDLGFAFLGTYFISALAEEGTTSERFLRLGAIGAAVALFKVDGFALIGLAAISFALVRLPRTIALLAAAASSLAMVTLAIKLGFMSNGYPWQLWIPIGLCAAILLLISGTSPAKLRISRLGIASLLLGFAPAIIRIVDMTQTVGSAAGYYIPAWVKHVPAAWHSSVQTLARTNVYAASSQPGVPGHFAPALVLWWGFSPLVGLLALSACVIAIRRKAILCELAGIVAGFDLAFLTVFRLDDLRHLLPLAPLIAILAVWAIRAIVRSRNALFFATSVVIASLIPFAWTAQEGIFGVASPLLTKNHWDQWHALSSASLVNSFAWGALLCAVLVGIARTAQSIESLSVVSVRALRTAFFKEPFFTHLLLSALLTAFTLFVFGALDAAIVFFMALLAPLVLWSLIAFLPLRPVATVTASILICGLLFVPLWSTAASPGLAQESSMVKNDWYGGYNRLLYSALASPHISRLLTYKSFGITWASLGRLQRIDLIDATDLAHYSAELRSKTTAGLIRGLGVQASILPSASSPERPTFERLTRNIRGPQLDFLQNPLLGSVESSANWDLTVFYPGTTSQIDSHFYVQQQAHKMLSLSDRNAFLPPGLRAKLFEITPLPVVWSGQMLRLDLSWGPADEPLGSTLYHASIDLRSNKGSLVIPVAALLAALPHGMVGRPVRIFEIRLHREGISGTLDFRSEGLTLTSNVNGATLTGYPFLLHPRWGVLRSINLIGRGGPKGDVQSMRLFPGKSVGNVDSPSQLELSLQPTMVCPNPNRVSAHASLLRASSQGKAQGYSTIEGSRPNGGAIKLMLPQTFTYRLTSITLTSNSKDCNVSEVIRPESFGLYLIDGKEALSTVPALPFHELSALKTLVRFSASNR